MKLKGLEKKHIFITNDIHVKYGKIKETHSLFSCLYSNIILQCNETQWNLN